MHAAHARQPAHAPLAVSLALSVAMHVCVAGGVAGVFAVRHIVRVLSPAASADAAADRKSAAETTPPPALAAVEPEDVIWVQPGIDDSSGDATAWIGYNEASEHHAAVSSVDQSAMTPDLLGMMGETPSIAPPAPPAPAASPTTATPPEPPAPTEVDTPADAALDEQLPPPSLPPASQPEPAPSTPTPPAPQTPPSSSPPPPAPPRYARDTEPAEAVEPKPETPREDPKEDPKESPKQEPDRAPHPELPVIGPPTPDQLAELDPVPDAPTPIDPSPRPVAEAAGPPIAGEPVTPAPERVPTPSHTAARATPPSPPPAPPPSGTPGEQADKEADATSIQRAVDYRLGRVHAGEGLDIKTVKPEFSNFTVLTALPRHPVVEITFTTAGKVKNVRLLQSSGYQDVDEPILNAVWAWTVSGKKLDVIARENPAALIKISVRMLL